MKLFLKGGQINFFDVSNLGGELVCFSLLLILYLLFVVYLSLFPHMR